MQCAEDYRNGSCEGQQPYVNNEYIRYEEGSQKDPEILENERRILQTQHGFHLIKLLGSGCFGEAWLASVPEHERSNYDGADKVVVKFDKRRRGGVSACQEYALMLGKEHPNVVKTFTFIFDCNVLVMEYCEGGTLLDFLVKQKEPISMDLRLYIADQLCSTLVDLHETETFHRDVRLSNIFIDSDNKIKLGDFGNAVIGGVKLRKSYELLNYVGKEIYESEEGNDPREVDIRFFGVILLKLLHFGKEATRVGQDCSTCSFDIPEWCPVPYLKFFLYCVHPNILHTTKSYGMRLVAILLHSLKRLLLENQDQHSDSNGVHPYYKQEADILVKEMYDDAKVRSRSSILSLNLIDEEKRKAAVEVLAKMNLKEDLDAVKALIKSLQDYDPGVRRLAAEGLGNVALKGNRDIEAALKACLRDTSIEVRCAAAQSLLYYFNKRDRCALVTLLSALSNSDEQVVQQATMILQRADFNALMEAVSSFVPSHEEAKTSIMLDHRMSVHRQAINIFLKTLNNDTTVRICDLTQVPQSIQELVRFLRSDPRIAVRSSSAKSLGSQDLSNNKVALEALICALQDEDSVVRKYAASSLGSQDISSNKEALEALISALYDRDSDVRKNAAYFLGKQNLCDSQAVLEALVKLLDDTEPAVRSAAVCGLGLQLKTPDQRVAESLIKGLQDSDLNVRSAVALSLGSPALRNNCAVAHALVNALKDSDVLVRRNAAASLGKHNLCGNKDVIQALIEALQDPDSQVRDYAACSLGEQQHLGNHEPSLQALIRALEDSDMKVRTSSAMSLSRFDRSIRKYLPQLYKTLHHTRDESLKRLIFALEQGE